MVIRRGDIWWASLPEPEGSEPGARRPVLIVQIDEFNTSAIKTVVIVALTSNLRLAAAPGNVLIKAGKSGLPKDSAANVSQVYTVDKMFLTSRVGRLPADMLEDVEQGLRLVLGL